VVHVVITGIEKVIPTLEDLATLMRLLPRSATGQSISNYVSLLTGVKKPEEHDGPEHLYFILVDNGRATWSAASSTRCCAASAAAPA
jgi:L-lactate dehydrogenase complex protein LldF